LSKTKLNPQPLLYPTPAVLIGTTVDGKPNFMTAAWCGVACSDPPMLAVGIRPARYTYQGIRQNLTFSINVPSAAMVRETDYCGVASGAKVDKAAVCGFKVFYGNLKDAPLIEQAPVNLECRVVHLLDLGAHILVIGRVENTFVSDDCLTDGRPDADKINPFAFVVGSTGAQYRTLGEVIGQPFGVGLELRPKA
jgi:flavin reductase (DIM6/NTAB) family NADH-FMN oxidoreductase RutF